MTWELKVRKQGYHAITQLSRVHSKCIKRNADVLLQLLQSGELAISLAGEWPSTNLDEQDEVAVVKEALIEHLNLNPQITLGVLCDQISADGTDDDDALRDKLRSLVIAFIGSARATIRRHAARDKELENNVAERLIAVSCFCFGMSVTDVQTVLHKNGTFRAQNNCSRLAPVSAFISISVFGKRTSAASGPNWKSKNGSLVERLGYYSYMS